jgi:hypothetical protein
VEILLVSLSSIQMSPVMEHTVLRGTSDCDEDTQSKMIVAVCHNWIVLVCCVVLMLRVSVHIQRKSFVNLTSYCPIR